MERDAVGIQGLSVKTEFQSCYTLLDVMLVYPIMLVPQYSPGWREIGESSGSLCKHNTKARSGFGSFTLNSKTNVSTTSA